MISGGRLMHVATRLTPNGVTDALGMRSGTFTASGTFRCDMRTDAATEQQYADGVAIVKNVEIRTRWPNIARVSLTELDRLQVRGRTLKINGIRDLDEAGRVAVIDCTEVT